MGTEPASEKGNPERGIPAADSVLSPRPGGIADALGQRLAAFRPALAAVMVWAIAFLVLGAIIVGLGLLLTHVLLPAGLSRFDAGESRWFARERTGTLNGVTLIGSDLGSTGVILGVAVLVVALLALGKHWWQIGFLAFALTLEFAVFLTTTFFIGRQRPAVVRLDASPPTSSYPSGHVATSLALYVGLALVLWSLVRMRWARVFVLAIAIALPIFVGVSRVYRGMHFPTDVAASVLLGGGALVLALLAIRSMAAASWARDHTARSPRPAELRERPS